VQAFEKSRKGFFPILITARRAPTAVCILQGISSAISNASERLFQSAANNVLVNDNHFFPLATIIICQ
jgi:hypothetical protein